MSGSSSSGTRWKRRWRAPRRAPHATLVAVALLASCSRRPPQVTLYCALDREYAEPIIAQFERQTGISVRAKFDTESTKSVALAEEILRERARTRCDVFWNNEPLHTARLAEAGMLAPRDSETPWHSFAGRFRVLLVNTDRVPTGTEPTTHEELVNSRWRGQLGIAKPLFGTTATHLACLESAWGLERTKAWLLRLKQNEVQILSGNRQVAQAVGTGSLAIGLTDTDDAVAEIRAGRPARMLLLDAAEGQAGALLLPNTAALVAGAPNPDAARRFLEFLKSSWVEETLAQGPSAQIPLGAGATVRPALPLGWDGPRLVVDYRAAARQWPELAQFLKSEFTGP